MANLFTNLSGAINAQVTVTSDMVSEEYKLTYTCSSIGSGKSFLLITGINTYLFPLQFVGQQEVKFKAKFGSVVTCVSKGDASISGLTLSTYSNVSEGDRAALELVKSDSSYWDRIKKITDDAGKVRTNMLEGLINLTINAFANESGTITQENGIMTFMNGTKPENSTQAVQICGGAIQISNNKDANGNWIWSTAINGAGIHADTIIASTLDALDFSAAKIKSCDVTTAHLKGCDIKGGELWIGDTMPENEAAMGNYTGMRVLSDGRIKGYYLGQDSFTLKHSHSGELILTDSVNGNSVVLSSSKTNPATMYSTGRGISIMVGAPQWDGSKYTNPRIEINPDGNIGIYAYQNGGTQTGTITIAGNLDIRGNIHCYDLYSQDGTVKKS